jgi:hypothetical protein
VRMERTQGPVSCESSLRVRCPPCWAESWSDSCVQGEQEKHSHLLQVVRGGRDWVTSRHLKMGKRDNDHKPGNPKRSPVARSPRAYVQVRIYPLNRNLLESKRGLHYKLC